MSDSDAFSALKMMVERGAEVRPRESRCDCAGLGFHHDLQQVVYDDGLHATCLRCRREWCEWHEWPKAGTVVTGR